MLLVWWSGCCQGLDPGVSVYSVTLHYCVHHSPAGADLANTFLLLLRLLRGVARLLAVPPLLGCGWPRHGGAVRAAAWDRLGTSVLPSAATVPTLG